MIRKARIIETIGRYRTSRLNCVETGEVLGISERHFRRSRNRHDTESAAYLVDWRLGRSSSRQAPVDRIEWVLEEYRSRYGDFTVKHFHAQPVRRHSFEYGYTWTKLALQGAGVVKKARRRGASRKRRPRRPLPGMLVFQDGAPYR